MGAARITWAGDEMQFNETARAVFIYRWLQGWDQNASSWEKGGYTHLESVWSQKRVVLPNAINSDSQKNKDTIKCSYLRVHWLMRNGGIVSVRAALRSFTVMPMLRLTNHGMRIPCRAHLLSFAAQSEVLGSPVLVRQGFSLPCQSALGCSLGLMCMSAKFGLK